MKPRRLRRPETVIALWLVAAAFVVSWAPSADGDIWWHLAAGREMIRQHGLLWTDPFSSGAYGRPWIDVHWLFQIGVYLVFSAAGLGGLVVIKGLLVAGGALILQRAISDVPPGQKAPGLLAVGLVLALFLTRHLLLVRPVIATLVFVAVYFHRLESFRRHGNWLALLWLLPLQIAWANIQGLSPLGPALIGAYAVGAGWAWAGQRRWPRLAAAETAGTGEEISERVPVLLVCLAACLAANLCTPFGTEGVRLSWHLLQRLLPVASNIYSANIVENVPPWSSQFGAHDPFWHLRWFLAWFAISFIVGRRRLVPSHLVLALGLTALAAIANRNVLLLYWLGVPLAVMNVAPSWRDIQAWWLRRQRRQPRRGRPVLLAAEGLAVVALTALALVAAAREPTIHQPAPWRAPTRSADIIAQQPSPGTIFAADNYGGYLIWRLYPGFQPYIDTRLILRTADEFAEYLALADDPNSFDGWERPFHFDFVLLPAAYPDRYLGLIAHLGKSPNWKLIYTDGTETLFARQSSGQPAWDLTVPATTDAILDDLGGRFAAQPLLHQAARLQLAMLQAALGNFGQAERALGGIATADADQIRARCRLAEGDLDGAQAIASRLLAADPRDVASLDLLAALALKRGDTAAAIGYLRRALGIDPHDADALRMLSELEKRSRDGQR